MAVSPLPVMEKVKKEPDYFVRFSVSQRIEHMVLVITFIVLAVTGLAEKYYTADWASWIILRLGGIAYTRLIHRAFGALFVLSALYHFGYMVYSLWARHSKPSMVPSLKDARDVVDTLRYTFGFADKPPQFGRYDYRQKFEYWGIIFGGTVMIITGFMLAYPLIVTYVLPGQFVAAAREAHGSEAMLAVLTIVIWHLYDTIFKPGIFPADTSIITGKISRKRIQGEHSLEYAEITSTGIEEEAPATDRPPDQPPE